MRISLWSWQSSVSSEQWRCRSSLRGVLSLTITEIIASFFVIAGTFFIFVASIGVLRLRDVYSRMHAAGKASTLGVMSIMTGAVIFFLIDQGKFNFKLLLSIIFIFITSPLAGLSINRSAYRSHVPKRRQSNEDEEVTE